MIALLALPWPCRCGDSSGLMIIGSQTGLNGTCGKLIRHGCAPPGLAGRSASGAGRYRGAGAGGYLSLGMKPPRFS